MNEIDSDVQGSLSRSVEVVNGRNVIAYCAEMLLYSHGPNINIMHGGSAPECEKRVFSARDHACSLVSWSTVVPALKWMHMTHNGSKHTNVYCDHTMK